MWEDRGGDRPWPTDVLYRAGQVIFRRRPDRTCFTLVADLPFRRP